MIAEMENHQLINQTSGEVEYYTPPEILDAVRSVFGGVIDLDPASSDAADKIVKARCYMTVNENSINMSWGADSVFLNFPFGRPEPACVSGCDKKHVHHNYDLHGNSAWVNKLCAEFKAANFEEACCLCYAATSEKWFKPLLAHPQCFLYGRTNYLLPDGTVKKGVTKGSVVTYLGPNINKFAQSFKHLGAVKIPYHY